MPTDLLILTNGPGEIATWVKPVVQALRDRIPNHTDLRISVMLSPCPHASGDEHRTALGYDEIDRVQPASAFFRFLLTGKTVDGWDWYSQGIVVFLGGDQLFPVLIGRRLGYPTVAYAEWEARWPQWIDHYGVMKPQTIRPKYRAKYRHKFTVVGDLMADVPMASAKAAIRTQLSIGPETELIGLMPGSKPLKLEPGVPLVLGIADRLRQQRPNAYFVIAVAPTVALDRLAFYADPERNSAVALMQGPAVELVKPTQPGALPYFQTQAGTRVYLWTAFPAFDLLSQCQLCLTTVGGNTAQLGALAVPMIVLVPTQRITAVKTWDGLPGTLTQLPGVGAALRQVINPLMIAFIRRTQKRLAWPNIWAQRQVVPELIGPLTPTAVAELALDYLDHPEKLVAMRQALQQLRGQPGAAKELTQIILDRLNYRYTETVEQSHGAELSPHS